MPWSNVPDQAPSPTLPAVCGASWGARSGSTRSRVAQTYCLPPATPTPKPWPGEHAPADACAVRIALAWVLHAFAHSRESPDAPFGIHSPTGAADCTGPAQCGTAWRAQACRLRAGAFTTLTGRDTARRSHRKWLLAGRQDRLENVSCEFRSPKSSVDQSGAKGHIKISYHGHAGDICQNPSSRSAILQHLDVPCATSDKLVSLSSMACESLIGLARRARERWSPQAAARTERQH